MADDWGKFQSLNRSGYSLSATCVCVCVCNKLYSSHTDADDFDPDAGFQKEGDEWAGEDEGLDTEVSLLTHGHHLSLFVMF